MTAPDLKPKTTADGTAERAADCGIRWEVLGWELVVDAVITAAIVFAIVRLGEPLSHILTSPLFIVATTLGIGHAVHKATR